MKVVVLGADGHIGKPLCYAFSRLGYDVEKADSSLSDFDAQSVQDLTDTIQGCDLVMSSLPYYLNERVATVAISLKVPYFDLGGHAKTSEHINQLAKDEKSLVFTDIGLAPGWINIVAEEAFIQIKPSQIEMAVGGIPVNQNLHGQLSYQPSWSIAGLLNEYRDGCQILSAGRILNTIPMYGLKDIVINNTEYECFYTSGGAAHTLKIMEQRGLKTCNYKTIRWPGHCRIMRWLLDALDDDDALIKIIEHNKNSHPNKVVMSVRAKAGTTRWGFEHEVLDDIPGVSKKPLFSAMEKCTAFAATAAIYDIMENYSEWNGPLNYSNIHYDMFNKYLEKIDDTLFRS